nr:hypothetical protein [uncultured Acetobacterium sp.]
METEKTVEQLIEELKKQHQPEMDDETLEIVINELLLSMLF